MIAWAYCLAYNEAQFIRYWVRHHLTFCERVIVYVDVDTDDGTFEIVEAEGGEARLYRGSGKLDDHEFVEFANTTYREAIGQADWVIWLDADEILYHERAAEHLAELHSAGVNLPSSLQYTMSSAAPPIHAGQVYDAPEFRKGHHVAEGGKLAIFDPNSLTIAWGVGKHAAYIGGAVVVDDRTSPFKVLHYRWLGEAYLRARDARNYSRLSNTNRLNRLGFHTYPEFVGPYEPGWTSFRPDQAVDVI